MFTLTVVVFEALIGLARGQGDCSAKPYIGFKCCDLDYENIDEVHIFHDQEVIDKCFKKHRNGNLSNAYHKDTLLCISECAVSEKGMLTDDRQLDRDAMTSFLNFRDPTVSTLMLANAEKCFATYKAQVDQSRECKSGAYEFQHCLLRECFLDCPSSHWTASSECDEMRVNVTQCPNVRVEMFKDKALA